MKEVEFANSVDPDEAAQNELPYLDLHCLPSLNYQKDIAWTKLCLKFAEVNIVICFFGALMVDLCEIVWNRTRIILTLLQNKYPRTALVETPD